MPSRRILAHSPAGEPLWVRLYIQGIGATWAAMLVTDTGTPPETGSLKDLAIFDDTPKAGARLAAANLGEGVAQS